MSAYPDEKAIYKQAALQRERALPPTPSPSSPASPPMTEVSSTTPAMVTMAAPKKPAAVTWNPDEKRRSPLRGGGGGGVDGGERGGARQGYAQPRSASEAEAYARQTRERYGQGANVEGRGREFDPYDEHDRRRAFGQGQGHGYGVSEETRVDDERRWQEPSTSSAPRYPPNLQGQGQDAGYTGQQYAQYLAPEVPYQRQSVGEESTSSLSRSPDGFKDVQGQDGYGYTNGNGFADAFANGVGGGMRQRPPVAHMNLPSSEKVILTWSAELAVPPDPVKGLGKVLSSKRLKSLEEVDGAKWSRFHAKVALIAAVGFFTDAYDIFSINIASIMLAYVYTHGKYVEFPSSRESGSLKAATSIGTLLGQLVFGWLADKVGRKRMYGIELIVIIIATFGQALTTANSELGTISIVPALFVWRLIMGFGIGGDYPLSAVISSEFAGVKMRGRMMTLVFSAQGWGQICAALVGYLTVLAFYRSIGSHHDLSSMPANDPILLASLDRSWRIIVGLGCLPAALAFYFRLTIPETPRFTMDIERNVKQAADDITRFLTTGKYVFDPDSVIVRVDAPRASRADFWAHFGKWANAKLLLGCAWSWFAIDVTFYGVGLNTDSFFRAVGFTPIDLTDTSKLTFTDAHSVYHYFVNYTIANMFLSGVGLIPGYYAACLLIDRKMVGRQRLQFGGFIILTVLFAVMGGAYTPLVHGSTNVSSLFDIQHKAAGFLALLLITSFFQNCGPNTTTFVIPGEMFPTRYRSTAHGISAASGKAGAILSQFALARIAVRNTDKTRFILLAFVPFAATGALATLLLKETRGLSLEELSGEDQNEFVRGLIRPEQAKDV